MVTLDTNTIIYHVSGDMEARDRIAKAIDQGGPLYVSSITVAELFRFPKLTAEEEYAIRLFLSACSIINIDTLIAERAGTIGRTHGLKLADSIIAATAIFTNSTLLTRNVRDFKRVIDLIIEAV